jgi:hypothetical protein
VSTVRIEARGHSAAIVEMSLKLAGERDPEALLQGASPVARRIMPVQDASMCILDEEGRRKLGLNGLIIASPSSPPAPLAHRPDWGEWALLVPKC